MPSVGIIANTTKPEAVSIAERIMAYLSGEGIEFVLEEELARALDRPGGGVPLRSMRADLLVIVGGDGTILRACLDLPDDAPPIMAVNVGERGFLTTVEPSEVEEALRAFFEGRVEVEERMRLEARIGNTVLPKALNEVCLTSKVPAKLFKARVRKNGTDMCWVEGDGLLVATPAGSTAYSLSCGGPVVDPGLRCLLLTPICPVRPSWPFVLPPDAQIEVEVVKAREPVAVVDGQAVFELEVGSVVSIRASKRPLRFVGLRARFYEKLACRGSGPHA